MSDKLKNLLVRTINNKIINEHNQNIKRCLLK